MPDDPAADFSEVSLHNMPGETTWPIVAISYMYIREDQTGNNKKGPLLKAWVEFVLSPTATERDGAAALVSPVPDIHGVMTPGDALRERVAGPRISTGFVPDALCRPFPHT